MTKKGAPQWRSYAAVAFWSSSAAAPATRLTKAEVVVRLFVPCESPLLVHVSDWEKITVVGLRHYCSAVVRGQCWVEEGVAVDEPATYVARTASLCPCSSENQRNDEHGTS